MIILFEFYFLEVPIPLESRATLVCIPGLNIIIFHSQLLEICSSHVYRRTLT